MRNDEAMQVRVKALYRHRRLLFKLPVGTSMADFAALLDSIGKTHGEPLAIEVTLPLRTAPPPC